MSPTLKTQHLFAILASLFLLTLTLISYKPKTPVVSTIISSIPERSQLASLEGADSGLVGWWKFDEGSGTTAGDASGNGNNGTFVGGTIWSDGKIGQAVKFDNLNDSKVVLSGGDLLGTGPLTISAWIYPITGGGGVGVNPSGRIVTNGKTEFQMDANNRVLFFCGLNVRSVPSSVAYNTWTYVTATRDAGGLVNLYVNGVLSGPSNQNCGSAMTGGIITSISSSNRPFDGKIDDVRVYNRVLSSLEVNQLFSNSSAVVEPAPIVPVSPDVVPPPIISPTTYTGPDFYIDPTFLGTSKNGSASNPWTYISSNEWQTINNALASSDVKLYFSSRLAGIDVAESYGNNLAINRTDISNHRLILDGMSLYNTNDSNPSWVAYSGNSRMKILGKHSLGIGSYKRTDNLTLRGFEVFGPEARVSVGGSNTIFEYLYIHDITIIGPAFGLKYATEPEGSCTVTAGSYSNVIVRNNRIENTYGEAMYISGTNRCPSYGNSHSNILIENNTITNAGINGAQGDGIDLKDGLTNVIVRGNIIKNTYSTGGAGATGITSSGVYLGKQNLVIENNIISGTETSGIQLGASWAVPNGIVIRNNTVFNSGNAGINVSGTTASSAVNTDISIYNNTLYNNISTAISVGNFSGVNIYNNLIFGNNHLNGDSQVSKWGITNNLSSDYNTFYPKIGWSIEGSHSVITSSVPEIPAIPFFSPVIPPVTPPLDTTLPTETFTTDTSSNSSSNPPTTNTGSSNPPANTTSNPSVTTNLTIAPNKPSISIFNPAIKQKTVIPKAKTVISANTENLIDSQIIPSESIIDITVPKIPSWKEVIINLITDIFNKIRMGIQRTLEVLN